MVYAVIMTVIFKRYEQRRGMTITYSYRLVRGFVKSSLYSYRVSPDVAFSPISPRWKFILRSISSS